jgi:competence protein ComEC
MTHWLIAEISGGAFLIVLVPLAWVTLPPGWPARKVALTGVIALVAWRPAPPPAACFDSWILDVGQGLAVAIQTHREVTLYDTGIAWRGGGSSAEQIIVPFLKSRGISRIDRLVVSHSDLDHSGGVDVLHNQVEVGFTIFGEPPPGDSWRCVAGQTWWSGAVRFEILHPPMPSDVSGNDASCVLRVSAGPHALLLTGDIEFGVERQLVQRRAALGADVAIVPHHGSLTSSSVPFIDSVRADVAIVSAAHANRWGFPKEQVVERWQASGAELLATAQAGAVYLRVCAADGIVELRREREERRRFWHADSQ